MQRPGWFALLGHGDPLRGETRAAEGRLLTLSGGVAVIVAPRSSLPLIEAWREILLAQGAKHVSLLAVSRREQACDRRLAGRLSEAPLVVLAAEEADEMLELISGTPLAAALGEVYRRGGVVAAALQAAPLLGETAPLGSADDPRLRYGLGLLRGVAVEESFESAGAFHYLSEVVLGRPDLVGIGLERGSAVLVGFGGRAEVLAGRVALLDASGVRASPGAVHGLRVDVLGPHARFALPALTE